MRQNCKNISFPGTIFTAELKICLTWQTRRSHDAIENYRNINVRRKNIPGQILKAFRMPHETA